MNSPKSELAGTANHFETLVAEGRYGEAEACFAEYCRKFKDTLRRLPPGDPRFRQMKAEWRLLFDQTRQRVLAGRSHAAARLARLPQRRRLYSAAAPSRPTWELIG
jgi:hypothetical protein